MACPIHAEISYWMERCNISIDNPVLKSDQCDIDYAIKLIESNVGKSISIKAKDTAITGDLISYVAICLHGIGTAFTQGIYKLNFSEYLDEIKRSWQSKTEGEKLEYMRIWTDSEKFLIINGLDYVRFGDFESQTLLQILQNRRSADKTTIIVLPDRTHLVGANNSAFFGILIDKLNEVSVK